MVPEFPTRQFTSNDKQVVSHIDLAHLIGRHQLRWEWYTPEGKLYQTTKNQSLSAPAGEYVQEATAHHSIALKEKTADRHAGRWQVKIYLDNTLEKTEAFVIRPPKKEMPPTHINFSNYHALVIGIDNYQRLEKLKSAQKDARDVADLLKKQYGFNVTLLLDATRTQIISSLDKMRWDLGRKDNLLIYYAGHGTYDKDSDEGYWLPVDAAALEVDTSQWLPHDTITRKLRAMDAKHVLVVADSCYAGQLVRGPRRGIVVKKKPARRDYYQTMAAKRARSVIVSGGMEPVMDGGGKEGHSVFASAFMEVLSENKDILDGTTLFSKLRRLVMLESEQTPQYSDIRKARHEGGDFIFVSQNQSK